MEVLRPRPAPTIGTTGKIDGKTDGMTMMMMTTTMTMTTMMTAGTMMTVGMTMTAGTTTGGKTIGEITDITEAREEITAITISQ